MDRIYPKINERYTVLKEIWTVESMNGRPPVGLPEGWEITIKGVYPCLAEVEFSAEHPRRPEWNRAVTFIDRSRFQNWLRDGFISLI